MNKSIIIHGPQGCGKSMHAAELAKHFGLRKIVELDDYPRQKIHKTDHLYLTSFKPSADTDICRRVMSFDQAMRQAGLSDRHA